MSATSNFFNRESASTVAVDPARLANLIETEEAEFNDETGQLYRIRYAGLGAGERVVTMW